ncbi:MAG TPA: BON domain-containing protein [Spongiibacteraceae bacterium]|nr:BON domain-containing protein [Spongiibacteraceae bacterium]
MKFVFPAQYQQHLNELSKVGILLAAFVVGGCTSIISETTDKPIESDPGSRTFGAVIDDQSIETTATVNIRKTDPNLDLAHIVVTSYNGVVLLTGQVLNEELRVRAAQTAAAVKNVRVVRNELVVAENSSFAARSSDTLLTTKIKSKLLTAKNIKDSRVKVITENGAVFLMGLVTHAEADIASTVAQETDGVQKVTRLFEYVD